MRETIPTRAGACMARMAAIGAGILLLTGCATGYSFVQPGVAGSGGYYTSEPYSGQGYYDYYGTGPYYAGTSGYGYYNGTWPYGGAYGYYGPGYYGYGPQWSFDVGISNVWNVPGYWGPWYSTTLPLWRCRSWRCGSSHYRHGRHHEHGSGSWRHEDASLSPPGVARTEQDRERAREMSAWQHDHFVRSPRWRATTGRFAGIPAAPVRMGEPAFGATSVAGRGAAAMRTPVAMPAPAAFGGAARAAPAANIGRAMAIRPAPAPAVQRSTRTNRAPGIKIR